MAKIKNWSRRQDLEGSSWYRVWQNDKTEQYLGVSNSSRPFVYVVPNTDLVKKETNAGTLSKSDGKWITRAENKSGAVDFAVQKAKNNPNGISR